MILWCPDVGGHQRKGAIPKTTDFLTDNWLNENLDAKNIIISHHKLVLMYVTIGSNPIVEKITFENNT